MLDAEQQTQTNISTEPLNQNKMEAKLIKEHGDFYLISDAEIKTGDEYIKLDNRPRTLCLGSTVSSYVKVPKLSLKNCQAIERGYDLDELVDEEISEFDLEVRIVYRRQLRESLANMFSKAVELMGDKKFSEFLDKEKELGISDIKTIERIQWYYNTYFDKSQQTEWDVDVKMRSKDIDELRESGEGFLNNKNLYVPELDADGCLILTRISE